MASEIKIGQSTDIHKLVENRPLIIGGVNIDYHLGLLGHSDADILSHAIAEAIIGALGKGDLGKHFPDTDDKYQDIDSLDILKQVKEMMEKAGYKIVNIDSLIIIEKPKLQEYIVNMQENIAKALNCAEENINIKATTAEGLGFIGREEGAMAEAIVLLKRE